MVAHSSRRSFPAAHHQAGSPKRSAPPLRKRRHNPQGPIGSPSFQREHAAQAAEEAQEAHQMSPALDNAQVELASLRSAAGRPKLRCAIRAAPPSEPRLACSQLDDSQRVALQSIAASDIDLALWLIATLPLSRGGLSARATRGHAEPACLASRLDAAHHDGQKRPRPSISRQAPAWAIQVGDQKRFRQCDAPSISRGNPPYRACAHHRRCSATCKRLGHSHAERASRRHHRLP